MEGIKIKQTQTAKTLLSVVLVALVLTACGKKEEAATQNLNIQHAVEKSREGNSSMPALPKEPAKKSNADSQYPLDKYTLLDIDDKERHFSYLWFSTGAKPRSEQELMEVFSPEYYNERDASKRKEIEARDKPRILAEIEKYKSMRYVAFVANFGMVLGDYDFARKGFPISNGDCWNFQVITGSNVHVNLRKTDVPCFLPVSDVEVAKKIEAVKAAHKINAQGIVYGFMSLPLLSILHSPSIMRPVDPVSAQPSIVLQTSLD